MDAPPTTTQKSSKGGATRRKGQKSLKNPVETGSSKSNSKDKSRPGSSLRELNNARTESPTDSIDSTTGSITSQSSTHSTSYGNTLLSGQTDGSGPLEQQGVESPGQMPEYQYSKDELMELKESEASMARPGFLASEFDTMEGKWDPDRWSRSDTREESSERSGGGQGYTGAARKRPSDLDRARTQDPKQRIKDESDEGLGIVLSPQRRSFLTGCHVTNHTGGTTDGNGAQKDDRRDQGRRVGSGRITLDRSNSSGPNSEWGANEERPPARDLRGIVGNRENRDFRDLRSGDYDEGRRGFGSERFSNRGRGDGVRDLRSTKDREPKDLRAIAREFGNRDRGPNSKYGQHGRYNRYQREEVEPEWLNEDIEQGDTMELHGFDAHEESKKKNREAEKDDRKSGRNPGKSGKNEKVKQPKSVEKLEKRKSPLLRRPKEEPEASESSVKSSPHKEHPNVVSTDSTDKDDSAGREQSVGSPTNGEFDFNHFLSAATIPGLQDPTPTAPAMSSVTEGAAPAPQNSGSRFSQFFAGSEARQSPTEPSTGPIGDHFNFLRDLVGHRSPTQGGTLGPTLTANGVKSTSPELYNPGAMMGAMQQHQDAAQPGMVSNNLMQLLNRNASPGIQQGNSVTSNSGVGANTAEFLRQAAANEQMGLGLPGLATAHNNSSTVQRPMAQRLPMRDTGSPPNIHLHHQGGASQTLDLLRQAAMYQRNSPPNAGQPHEQQQPVNPPSMKAAPIGHAHTSSAATRHTTSHIPQTESGTDASSMKASDVERNLKALLLNNAPGPIGHKGPVIDKAKLPNFNTPPPPSGGSPAISLPVPLPGKMMSVAELEASLGGGGAPQSSAPPSGNIESKQLSPTGGGGQRSHAIPNMAIQMQQQRNLYAALQRQQHGTSAGNPEVVPPTQAVGGMPPSQAPPTSSNSDMTAYNKLVGMLTVNGNLNLGDAPSMATITAQAKALQLQQQRLKQSQPIKPSDPKQMNDNMILNFMKQNPTIKSNPPSGPLATQPPSANANGQATHQPSSQINLPPSAPKMTLQAPLVPGAPSIRPMSPRPGGVSPAPPSLMPPPTSPRAASPIMFGSQPPMHLTAPSPIHANASTSPTPTSNNTLQVNPQVSRVPSPQELRFHTQRIMQNALIKKQLEEQKERFMKKQQDRGKSPNIAAMGQFTEANLLEMNLSSPPATQPVITKPPPIQAFTPTSVIRKMATDKADKQSNKADLDGSGKSGDAMMALADQLAQLSGGNGTVHSGAHPGGNPTNGGGGSGGDVFQQSNSQPRALFGKGVMHGSGNTGALLGSQASMMPPGSASQSGMMPPGSASQSGMVAHGSGGQSTVAAMFANNPTSVQMSGMQSAISNAQNTQGRAIMKGGQQQQQSSSTGSTPSSPAKTTSSTNNGPNMDLAAILAQQSNKLQSNNYPRMPTSKQYSTLPLTARVPGPSANIRGGGATSAAVAAHLQMQQRMMQGRGIPMAQHSLAALQAQAAAAQHRSLQNAGLQTSPPYNAPPPNVTPPGGVNPAGLLGFGRAVSPQPPNHQARLTDFTSQPSDIFQQAQGAPGTGDNLSKWFGSDVIQQGGFPSMPPLPTTQGQSVMSLDEIEQRQQQTVSH